MHVEILEEATKIADIYHRHPNVIVLFQYPEHASSSFGVADIGMLAAMSKSPFKPLPSMRDTLRQLSSKLLRTLNSRLKQYKMTERVHSAPHEDEDYYDPTLWFFEKDASTSRIVWLREKLRQIQVYVFIVSYGSELHNAWNSWVQD